MNEFNLHYVIQESTVDMDQLMNDLDEEANTAEEEAAKVKADALAISLKANRIQGCNLY